MMSLIIAVLIMIFGHIFLDPILTAFGASQAILPYAHDYMEIMLFSTVFKPLSA
jgi:Na+-driven multidrug efflux pump